MPSLSQLWPNQTLQLPAFCWQFWLSTAAPGISFQPCPRAALWLTPHFLLEEKWGFDLLSIAKLPDLSREACKEGNPGSSVTLLAPTQYVSQ